VHRTRDLLLDKSLPRPEWIGVVYVELVLGEVTGQMRNVPAHHPSVFPIHPSSQFGVDRDGPIQQQRRHACVLEMARVWERFVHRGKIIGVRIQTRANAIEVAERGKELERSRKKGLCGGIDRSTPLRGNG
jgi:hypothetical protein